MEKRVLKYTKKKHRFEQLSCMLQTETSFSLTSVVLILMKTTVPVKEYSSFERIQLDPQGKVHRKLKTSYQLKDIS
jgi:hypothetical protein